MVKNKKIVGPWGYQLSNNINTWSESKMAEVKACDRVSVELSLTIRI